MKLSSIETSFSRKSHARARFQESQFRLFHVQNLEYWQSALFYNSHIEGKSCSQASWFAREWSIARIIGERHTDGTMQISQLRQSWEIVERGSEGAAKGQRGDARGTREGRVYSRWRREREGERRAYREAESSHRQRAWATCSTNACAVH